MRTHDTDVLIVGSGPAGLTLASDLHVRGIDFQIIDAMPNVIDWDKAHGLSGRALELLDIVGLAEPMMSAATYPPPGRAFFVDGELVCPPDTLQPVRPEPYPYMLPMPQHDIELTLESELEKRGRKVERNTRLVRVEQDAEGVSAVVEFATDGGGLGMYRAFLSGHGQTDQPEKNVETATAERTIRARWLVGCDGAHSETRKALGLSMHGETVPTNILFTECTIDWTHPKDLNFFALTETGSGLRVVGGLYVPFSDNWNVFFVQGLNDRRLSENPTLEELQQVFRETTGLPDVVLRDPKSIDRINATNFRICEHMVLGRVALAGDAAHVRSALGGTGMNSGIHDAMNLGWKLALSIKGAAAPGLILTYEEEQRAEAIRLSAQVRILEAMGKFFTDDETGRGTIAGGVIAGIAALTTTTWHQRGAMTAASAHVPSERSLAGRYAARRARKRRRQQLIRFRTKVRVGQALQTLFPRLGHVRARSAALMDANHRVSSLTQADPPLEASDLKTHKVRDWLAGRSPMLGAVLKAEVVQAGDYCPDAVCRAGAIGTHVRHMLRGPKANLWLFCGDEPVAETVKALDAIHAAVAGLEDYVNVRFVFPSEVWADRLGHPYADTNVVVDGKFEVRRAMHVNRPEVIYVRPDGYIGLRTHNLSVPPVLDYLRRIYNAEPWQTTTNGVDLGRTHRTSVT